MSKIVTVDGKKYKVSRVVYHGDANNMVINVVDIETIVYDQEVASGRFVQFRDQTIKKNELYMEFQTVAPAHIEDGAQISLERANPRNQYLETIWEGTYGQIPTGAGERIDVNNIIVPVDEVKIDPTEHILIKLTAAAQTVVANCVVELHVQEFVHYRL